MARDDSLTLVFGKLRCLLRAHLPLVVEIALVTDENDGYFLIGVVPHLLQPLSNRFKRCPPRNIVDEKNADRLSIISVRNGTVPFLTSRVPDLCPDKHVLDWNVVRGEFHSNRSMRLPLELVFRVAEQELGLADFRIADQHKFKHVVIGCTLLLIKEALVCHVFLLLNSYK